MHAPTKMKCKADSDWYGNRGTRKGFGSLGEPVQDLLVMARDGYTGGIFVPAEMGSRTFQSRLYKQRQNEVTGAETHRGIL